MRVYVMLKYRLWHEEALPKDNKEAADNIPSKRREEGAQDSFRWRVHNPYVPESRVLAEAVACVPNR